MDEPTRRAWAAKVRPAREAQGLSQEALANMARAGGATVTGRTVRDMEKGGKTPHLETLLAVLEALGLDPDRDPQVDADAEALTTLLRSLVRRLPENVRAERAEQLAADLASAIKEAAHDRAASSANADVVLELPDSGDTDQREAAPLTDTSDEHALRHGPAGGLPVGQPRKRTSRARSKADRTSPGTGQTEK